VTTVAHNIRVAKGVAADVVKCFGHKGIFPVTPHLNTAQFESLPGLEAVEDDYWLNGTAELLKRCDAVLLTFPDAGRVSAGTANEILLALKLGKPVYRSIMELDACITYCPERMAHFLVPAFDIPMMNIARR
jgi:nucleoside 2-deoxyribosyltransferase